MSSGETNRAEAARLARSSSTHPGRMLCAQCEQLIDESQPYHLGGEVGIMGEITRPSHLGDCETMPVFVWESAARWVPGAAKAAELFRFRSKAAKKAWATMRARRAA